MTEVIETTPAPSAVEQPIAVPENPAIARCMGAWARAYKAEKAIKNDDYDAMRKANHAYCNSMPRLSGYENIRDFIACVAHAMLIRVIDRDDGSKILYAAQVALSTVRSQPPALKLADPLPPSKNK
jgi:hypothetical protein